LKFVDFLKTGLCLAQKWNGNKATNTNPVSFLHKPPPIFPPWALQLQRVTIRQLKNGGFYLLRVLEQSTSTHNRHAHTHTHTHTHTKLQSQDEEQGGEVPLLDPQNFSSPEWNSKVPGHPERKDVT